MPPFIVLMNLRKMHEIQRCTGRNMRFSQKRASVAVLTGESGIIFMPDPNQKFIFLRNGALKSAEALSGLRTQDD